MNSSHQRKLRLGTRTSILARWQTDSIAAMLRQVYPDLEIQIIPFTTRGDRAINVPLPQVGGKGLFTAELEQALHSEEIDLAVHSLKDLPTDDPVGLTIGAIPQRAPAQDVLVSRDGYTLDTLPHGAAIGTCSTRRAAQILNHRSDVRILDIRGNIDTRVSKALDPNGPYDAIVLAQAGLVRLGYQAMISEVLPVEVMLPAPGQGALAVQCRADRESLELLKPLDHPLTRHAVTAERAFLAGLGGGCSVPVAAYSTVHGAELHLHGRVLTPDGSKSLQLAATTTLHANAEDAAASLGRGLAEAALKQGAKAILQLKDIDGFIKTHDIHDL